MKRLELGVFIFLIQITFITFICMCVYVCVYMRVVCVYMCWACRCHDIRSLQDNWREPILFCYVELRIKHRSLSFSSGAFTC